MKAKFKNWWGVQSTRINALSLRERVFLFLSVIVCSLALADVMWLSPAQLAHKQLKQRFEKQNIDLQRARDELKTTALPVSFIAGLSDETEALQLRLAVVNQSIKNAVPVSADATPLPQVLVHFLSRHEGLALVRVTVTAPEAPVAKPTQGSPTAPSVVPTLLTRQGVELTVSGPYSELVKYVQTLEKALPQVRWGSMKLKSEKLPPELTLQLFLVGVPA